MGCGAVCGNSSSIYQPNQYSQKILLQLVPQLTHASKYISQREYNAFLTQIKQNPLKYRLKLSQKLIPKQQTDPGILVKWKLILYCFDSSNPDFVSCLDHKFKINTTVGQSLAEPYQKQPSQNFINDQDDRTFPQTQTIYSHQQFSQIEKDIDRTCDLSQNKKKTFQRILKRITNYFPQMGYTQGINFIIGYLLMVGFSQFDAFWMFVHIAIHKRYLQLGLLEDKFPLSQVYNRIFRNILKRINYPLYQHLYEVLMMDQSVWVFKWFITYFIYSFPFEMIKYVFDIVIELGGIGLIKLAIAITMDLSHVLMGEHDVCEISLFFQSLRNVDTFNEYLSISRLLDRAYRLEIGKEDFAGIEEYKGNFYSDYILANLQMQQQATTNVSQQIAFPKGQQLPDQKNKKKNSNIQKLNQNPTVNKLLKTWYQKLITQRQTFIKKKKLQKNLQVDQKKNLNNSLQNQLHLLIRQDQDDQNSIKSPEKQNSINENKNSIKDSVEVKKQSVPSTGYSFNKKGSGIHNRGDVSEIDELWDEEDRNSSISKTINSQISQQSRTQNGFNPKVRNISYEDQLDKLASTHCNPSNKLKTNAYSNNNYNKVSSIFTEDKLTSIKPKINNFHIPSDRTKPSSKGNNFVRVGQHILNNLSINQHSQHESSNSEYSKLSQKEKKCKENQIYSKNYFKNKSKKHISFEKEDSKRDSDDIKSHDVHEQNSSSRDSFNDPQNSFYASNEFIHQDLKNNHFEAGSVKAFDSHRERMNTHQDALTTSLHASHIKENVLKEVGESHVSEIEIFQAPQVFKKKNRVSSRISGAQNQAYPQSLKAPKLSHTISEQDIKQKGQNSAKTLKMGIEENSINYEESYESIFVPSEGKKSNTFGFHQQLQKCEVESVK